MTTNNLIQFNSPNDRNVYNCIRIWLNRLNQDSKNTRKSYEHAVRDFFLIMRNKKIEDLVEEDLIFTKPQVEAYQITLRDKWKATTVNNKISALKGCYQKFKDYGFAVDPSWFEVKRYKERDKESYDTLTHEEICAIIELVSKTRKGFEKALLIRLAYATAFRKEALLSLKWTDITNRDGIWFIKALDKGDKWDQKKISNSLYNELMKQKALIGGTKVFQLTSTTVKRMMKMIQEKMDFGDRRIVFHSIKKASLNEVNILSKGDLKLIQKHGNHSSVSTSLNDYIAKKELDDLLIIDTDKSIPLEVLDEISREDLVAVIKRLDRNTQIKVLQEIGAM